ncbi:MAG TPA: aminopeptidase P N-terminal domain-containing protein, partial [Pirellulales bacterium]
MYNYQKDFPIDEFRVRREKIMDRIGPHGVAVLAGLGSTGAFDFFRQSNEFYYLTGVEVPHAYLLIDGKQRRSTLYLPHHDAKHERSDGPQLHCDAPDGVSKTTGIEIVAPLKQLALDVEAAKTIFTLRAPAEGRQACQDTLRYQRHLIQADPWNQQESREAHFLGKLATLAPKAAFENLSPILDEMRLLKSPRELEQMRRTGRLTAEAVVAAIRRTRPGLFEYQLVATAEYIYLNGGAKGGGYRAIAAQGPNIWNAHYFRNDCQLEAGELMLLDYAPDMANYTSDIGRMWPINGKYTTVQRELYGFVVEYQKVLLKVIRPHATIQDLSREAAAMIRPVWESWPFSKPAYREATRKMIESEIAFTHPVGMAVHDVGAYKHAPLQPGLVFALDPQMWVHEENLYIRVEDTVAVTADGVESHTAAAPLDLDEVEALVGADR